MKMRAQLAIPATQTDTVSSRIMSASKLPIDPKELTPAAIGVVLGVVILIGFVALASALGLTLLVDHGNIPHQ
jgi:hypothetical protein